MTLRGTRSWEALKKAGVTRLRCGRYGKGSSLGCSLPQGHKGAHDFTVNQTKGYWDLITKDIKPKEGS